MITKTFTHIIEVTEGFEAFAKAVVTAVNLKSSRPEAKVYNVKTLEGTSLIEVIAGKDLSEYFEDYGSVKVSPSEVYVIEYDELRPEVQEKVDDLVLVVVSTEES